MYDAIRPSNVEDMAEPCTYVQFKPPFVAPRDVSTAHDVSATHDVQAPAVRLSSSPRRSGRDGIASQPPPTRNCLVEMR